MSTATDLAIARVRAYRLHVGWSVYRLSKAAGLDQNTCMRMDSPGWNPRATTLRKLERLIPPDFGILDADYNQAMGDD